MTQRVQPTVDANQVMQVQRPIVVQSMARRSAFARALDEATSAQSEVVVRKGAASTADSKGSEHGRGDELWRNDEYTDADGEPLAAYAFHAAFVHVDMRGEEGFDPNDQPSGGQQQDEATEYAIPPVDGPPPARGDSVDDDTPEAEDGEGADGPSDELVEAFDRALGAMRVTASSEAGDRGSREGQEEIAPLEDGQGVQGTGHVGNDALTAAGEAASSKWRTGDATQRYDFVGDGSPVETVELVCAPDGTYVANVDIIDLPAAGVQTVVDRLRRRLSKTGVAVVRLFMGGRAVAESSEERDR